MIRSRRLFGATVRKDGRGLVLSGDARAQCIRDAQYRIEEGRESAHDTDRRRSAPGVGRVGSIAVPRAQPHSARCESRACGNKQFVTSRGSKPATAYALSRILPPFLSLRLRLLFSCDSTSLTRLPRLPRSVRFLPFSSFDRPSRRPRAFTHDVTPPPSPRSDVTINSRRITLFSTLPQSTPHTQDR